ncbi:hypothetical protein [Actinosynnema pretiosum]|uniref:hypothetical protein n=1 Tax=Actinosynnema pretiosum TaxID=42197 RepID=UPI0012FD68EC|nr:hypothetical protein [Actinosynnema pretiosum]
MDLGPPHGIRFRFSTGLVRAVLLDAHGKPPLPLAEALSIDVGTRELAVAEDHGDPLRAVLRQRYDLAEPVEWRLHVPGDASVDGDGVQFALPTGTSVRVTSTGQVSATEDGVVVALPAGPAEIDVEVVSEPQYAVSDTVVVCRAHQAREAAVVVSCLPGDRFTPVVALDRPPPAGGRHALPGEHDDELDAPGPDTGPLRSWNNRNSLLADLMRATGVRRAVVLADPPPQAAHVFDGMEHVRLLKPDLLGEDLTDEVWALLHGEGRQPAKVLEAAPGDDPAQALYTALRTGSALRFTERADPLGDRFAAAGPESGDEAVLVETTGEADDLVAACYAHHRGARLVTTPQPDLDEVGRVVAEEQARVTEAASAIGDAVKGIAVGEALWRYLSTGGHDPYPAVESVVTAQVPADAVHAVGERRLTAFTAGLPYPFVRTATGSWARKPIGHVTTDPALVVLTELHREGACRPRGAFALLVDPGFPAAPADRAAHVTHPVVLTGAETALPVVAALAADLPVEVLAVNAHDAEGNALLDGSPLPPWLVAHALDLPHQPVVLNNSCLSWTDQAREYLRVGARGYVGALWRIPPDLAADFTRVVVRRLTAGEVPAARAVVDTGLPGGIERSYLYAGTANGRLDRWRAGAPGEGESALTGCALLAGVDHGGEEVLRKVVHREMSALRRAAETTPASGTEAYVDTLFDELSFAGDLSDAAEVVEKIDKALPALDLPPAEADRRWAARYERTGALHEHGGDHGAALADYGRSASYGDAGPDRAGVLLRMAALEPRPEEALRLASQAYRAAVAAGDRDTEFHACSSLNDLGRRTGDLDTALKHAVIGHDLAAVRGDRVRQTAFKVDECALRRELGDPDGAIEAGTDALELVRAQGDPATELRVIGELARCHEARGDLAAALSYTKAGLSLSEHQDAPGEFARFQDETGRLLTRRGEHAEALRHYRSAVEGLVARGSLERGAELLPHLAVGAVRAGDAGALWTTALCGGLVCEVVERDVWQALVPLVVDSMKRAIEIGSAELTQRGMTDFASAVTAGRRDDMPVQVGVLSDVVVLLLAWLMGRIDDSMLAFGREVDRQTGGVLDLVGYVSTPYAQRVRGGAVAGRWSAR